jgi:hypothetical protein
MSPSVAHSLPAAPGRFEPLSVKLSFCAIEQRKRHVRKGWSDGFAADLKTFNFECFYLPPVAQLSNSPVARINST